jgi:Zn-dependent protease with chaperone function
MPAAPSLAARAIGAILLMVGFYALALVMAGALLAIPFAEFRYAHRVDLRLALFGVLGGFAILRAIVPRRDRFDPPGPELRPDAQPRLFAAIAGVAQATGQARPRDVYLIPDVNAWVAQRGGLMGVESHRVMGLGLPLLETVSINELRAILAHEFGHYHGGDTALGPWIYKTRAAIGRTLVNLSRHSSLLMKPFEWYGAGFLRITHAISRRQEYAADALAARVVGAAPLASGLRALHAAGAAFGDYWATEVGPLLERGYRPPIAAGFTHFLATPHIAPLVAAALEQEMTAPTLDPYDTHPPLRDRIAALGASATSASADTGPRAITLLDNIDALEAELMSHLVKVQQNKPLTTIGWQDAGTQVWAAIWRDALKEAGNRLDGITPAHVAALDIPAAAVRLGYAPRREAADANAGGKAMHILGCALAIALINQGWAVSALPGEVVVLSRDEASMKPFADLGRLARKEITPDDWKAMWAGLGLLDLDLGTLRERPSAAAFLKSPPGEWRGRNTGSGLPPNGD